MTKKEEKRKNRARTGKKTRKQQQRVGIYKKKS